jgi:N-acetylated-alpha-linked acidic dipeptidase
MRTQPERAVLRSAGTAFFILFVLLNGSAAAQDAAADLPGFWRGRIAAQRSLEQQFLAVPSSASAAATVRALTMRPHLAGTPAASATADTLASWLRGLGFDVEIERFDVWLPQPERVGVTLVAEGASQVLRVREPPAGSGAAPDDPLLMNWMAWAANGDVTAPVVYANYALPADFDALESAGVDVRGAIVLARLGRVFRGVKVAEAERRGAAGVVLYPDPAGDGFGAGDTVPGGPYRPAWSVQRGTLMYMWQSVGDPLTPGRPAIPGEPRLAREDVTNLPRIPVVSLGYGEAAKILERLEGAGAPAGFRGALRVPYRVGPGPARVRIVNEQSLAARPIRNVIARLPGVEDTPVIAGNHFDAWLAGAADPHVGTAVMIEIAKGLSALRAQGWRPRRTIVLGFWDAEEFGVVGSTEWVEKHRARLAADAVAYLNIDTFTSGTLDVSGAPGLRDVVASAARDVQDPLAGKPLLDAWTERQRTAWQQRPEPRAPFALSLGDIGAGSDWTAFLHFAGVPSLQWTMNGRGTYAVYHSSLDDHAYAATYVDSAFTHTPALARAMGLALLRLTEADALPFRYSLYAQRIAGAIDALDRRHADARIRPDWEGSGVRAALAQFERAARDVEFAQDAALRAGETARLGRLNRALPRVETAFLSEIGLPGRPWYRHPISAPGADTGYDALWLPAVAEALRAGDRAALDMALTELRASLLRAAATLTGALGGD